MVESSTAGEIWGAFGAPLETLTKEPVFKKKNEEEEAVESACCNRCEASDGVGD